MSNEGSWQIPATPPPPMRPAMPSGRVRNPSTLLGLLGAVLGLLGLIAGVAAWFRAAPAHDAAKPVYSEQQVADARQVVCDAYRKGIRTMRTVASKRAGTPEEALPIAVNSRAAEVAVSTYFLNVLEENPAAPSELQVPVRNLANYYQNLALIQLADGTPDDWRSTKNSIEDTALKLDQKCL